jgi:hypothetical protein
VISHGLWQRRFGGDAGIVGRDVLLSGDKYTVIGSCRGSSSSSRATSPSGCHIAFEAEELTRRSHYLTVVGRLKPGVAAAAAEPDVQPSSRAWRSGSA